MSRNMSILCHFRALWGAMARAPLWIHLCGAAESELELESVGVGNFGRRRSRSRSQQKVTYSDSGLVVVDILELRRDTADF